jgi:type I restriction-modification system DNA methylase subunit
MTNYDFLAEKYNPYKWKDLIRSLFPAQADVFAREEAIPMDSDRILSFKQFGTLRLNDQYDTQLALFEIRLAPKTTKLEINRVALNKIVSKINENALLTGALAVYVDDDKEKWRFSFIAKRHQYNKSGELEKWETEPKRYTYLFGKGEKTLTAQQRFSKLDGTFHKRLEDLEEAFSVESVSKEFFNDYKTLYTKFCEFLYSYPQAQVVFSKEVDGPDEKKREELIKKLMRDFAKKLLGRLVFLYFLQKKRWLGGVVGSGDWQDGKTDFIRLLFKHTSDKEKFYSTVLAPLYFNTLNTKEDKRPGFEYYAPSEVSGQFDRVKVPFLNGGLFEEDLAGTEKFDFPATLFQSVFELFDRFNFTVDENSPNDHEVGIDPEMLGHIFENLLEENKEKGAFYTPKEIVHYMCQESLLLHLKSKLVSSKPETQVQTSSSNTFENELEDFVRHKKVGDFVNKNAAAIIEALKNVRICDPAIGSGAFPMGLLHEIFHCRVVLQPDEKYATLKKNIIHHCIYGVDRDKGAVDIARLRFWLSLVVEEESPQELPNLDYKIMQGDSLMECFGDVPLDKLATSQKVMQVKVVNPQMNMFSGQPENAQTQMLFDVVEETPVDEEEISDLIDEYFDPNDRKDKSKPARDKKTLHELIDKKVFRHIEYNLEIHRNHLKWKYDFDKDKFDAKLEKMNSSAHKERALESKEAKLLNSLKAELDKAAAKLPELYKIQEQAERPFFLWNLYFKNIFEEGGFDIVIGNPPYVRQELLGDLKPILAKNYPLTFKSTADILVYFVELSYSKLLKQGGQFAFIINNKWIRSGYGEGMRQMLATQVRVQQLLDFGDLPVFDGAMAYPCILFFKKAHPSQFFEVVLFEDVPWKKEKTLLQEILRLHFPVSINTLDNGQWHLHNPKDEKVLKILTNNSLELGEYINNKAYYGIKTGASQVFIIDSELNDKLEQDYKILKPMLLGRDLKKFETPSPEKFLIKFEKGYTDNNRGNMLPQEWLSIKYPLIFNHLIEHENKAKERYDKGDYWWELRACDYYQYFEEPKIMYQSFQVSPCFVFDEKGLYCNNSMWIIPLNDKFLLGYLNSNVGWWCITKYCSRIQNGYQLMYDYLKNIPVPILDETQKEPIIQLVNKIIKEKQQGQATMVWEAKIDALLMWYLGMTEEDALYLLQSIAFVDKATRTEVQNNLRDLQRGTFNEEQ